MVKKTTPEIRISICDTHTVVDRSIDRDSLCLAIGRDLRRRRRDRRLARGRLGRALGRARGAELARDRVGELGDERVRVGRFEVPARSNDGRLIAALRAASRPHSKQVSASWKRNVRDVRCKMQDARRKM